MSAYHPVVLTPERFQCATHLGRGMATSFPLPLLHTFHHQAVCGRETSAKMLGSNLLVAVRPDRRAIGFRGSRRLCSGGTDLKRENRKPNCYNSFHPQAPVSPFPPATCAFLQRRSKKPARGEAGTRRIRNAVDGEYQRKQRSNKRRHHCSRQANTARNTASDLHDVPLADLTHRRRHLSLRGDSR